MLTIERLAKIDKLAMRITAAWHRIRTAFR